MELEFYCWSPWEIRRTFLLTLKLSDYSDSFLLNCDFSDLGPAIDLWSCFIVDDRDVLSENHPNYDLPFLL